MGLLDSINLIDLDGPRLTGRRGVKMLKKGERCAATIVGVEVSDTSGSEETSYDGWDYAFAFEVRGPHGMVRTGARQRLHPDRWRAHVGAEVVVAQDGGRTIVDWEQTLVRAGAEAHGDTADFYKPLDDPPADGVVDRHQKDTIKRLEAGDPASATVIDWRWHEVAGMQTMSVVLDLELRHPDGRVAQRRTGHTLMPDYARHALAPGAVLRVGVDARKPDKVHVDWVALANAPGVRRPVPEWSGETFVPKGEPDPVAFANRIAGRFGITIPDPGAPVDPATAPAAGDVEQGVSFDRWCELKGQLEVAGVGRKQRDAWAAQREPSIVSWKELDGAWTKRMQRDAGLSARYTSLYPEAVQRALAGAGAGASVTSP